MSENINISADSEGLTGVCLSHREESSPGPGSGLQRRCAQRVGGCRAAWSSQVGMFRVAEVGVGRVTELRAWG